MRTPQRHRLARPCTAGAKAAQTHARRAHRAAGGGAVCHAPPQRPNPLDIGAPRLLRRAGCTLWVSGIDAWPGTPILDIKGYAPRDDLRPDATVPEWLETLWSAHDAERG